MSDIDDTEESDTISFASTIPARKEAGLQCIDTDGAATDVSIAGGNECDQHKVLRNYEEEYEESSAIKIATTSSYANELGMNRDSSFHTISNPSVCSEGITKVKERSDSIESEIIANKESESSSEIEAVERVNCPLVSSGVEQSEETNSAVEQKQDENLQESNAGSSPPKATSSHHIQFSRVETATAGDTMIKIKNVTQPLTIEWTFGFNRRVPCLNLATQSRNTILFAASHITVLYDYENNCQKLLQGHTNGVTCTACSEDRRWVATADEGPNNCVIVWDTYSGIPVQVLFEPHVHGVTLVGLSHDAKYLATVSAGMPQEIAVWDWTTNLDTPIGKVLLDDMCQLQTCIRFHPFNNKLFLTNSEDEVFFFSWTEGSLEYDAPLISDASFNRNVGLFTQSVFQRDIPQRALSATLLGNIVVWEPERSTKALGGVVPDYKKRALKLVRVKDKGLTAIAQTDCYIVVGDTAGHVTFYDSNLALISSYTHFKIGSINGISFKHDPNFSSEPLEGNNFPTDFTIPANTFVVRDFILSTKAAEIIHVQTDGTVAKRICKEHDGAVYGMATSPNKPWICIGGYGGLLQLWNYETKKVLVTRVLENKAKVRSLAFNHNGLQIAAGMASGAIHVIDAISLCDELSIHYARDAITHCAYSHDSKFLAAADAGYVTTVLKYYKNTEWRYLGRFQAHYQLILDLSFGFEADTNLPRLMTLGKDRLLVEYDLQTSSTHDLKLLSVDRIEQSGIPLCMTWYPPVCKESFLLTSNDQYKMKLYNVTTKMCRRTFLGPTFGSPVRLITVIPTFNSDPSTNRMLCYATDNQIGLQLLPLDGNPHRSFCSIAHPRGVVKLICSNDGKFIFSAGGKESDVHMWSVNMQAMEGVASMGGKDLIPFYGMLDGGKDGEIYTELENYFYYAQLRSQGINATEERAVSRVVPLEQVPFLMRALGFYPSEQEIEDMMNESKYGQYVDTGNCVTEIDLGDFIKLYVNHRPAFGLSPDDLHHAFEVLGHSTGDNKVCVNRHVLLSALQRKGEHMTECELAECLATLLGFCPEGGSVELGESLDHDEATSNLEQVLPEAITPSMFASEILGLSLYG